MPTFDLAKSHHTVARIRPWRVATVAGVFGDLQGLGRKQSEVKFRWNRDLLYKILSVYYMDQRWRIWTIPIYILLILQLIIGFHIYFRDFLKITCLITRFEMGCNLPACKAEIYVWKWDMRQEHILGINSYIRQCIWDLNCQIDLGACFCFAFCRRVSSEQKSKAFTKTRPNSCLRNLGATCYLNSLLQYLSLCWSCQLFFTTLGSCFGWAESLASPLSERVCGCMWCFVC